jgi:hypothetical protein
MYSEDISQYVSRVFGMHDFEIGLDHVDVDQANYPLDDIIKSFESCFFTCTISYMIALALHEGIDEIELHGVDLNGTREFVAERSSVFYWIGRAEGIGVKVTMSNNINKPVFLYGYQDEGAKILKDRIDNMIAWAIQERDNNEEQRVKDQYTGYALGLDTLRKEL